MLNIKFEKMRRRVHMHFRLELFVEDLQRSIRFYEEILTLVFSKKNTTGAMIKLGDFFFIIDP